VVVTYDRGAQLAKFNVFIAYRVSPVNPVDRHLFGICWKEHVDTDQCKGFTVLAHVATWELMSLGRDL